MVFILLPGEVREGRNGGSRRRRRRDTFCRLGDAGPIALEEWQLI